MTNAARKDGSNKQTHREKRHREREREQRGRKKPSNWATERPSAERSGGCSKLYMAEKSAACIQVSRFTPFRTV